MGLVYAVIGFILGWRTGQMHWKHGVLILVLAGIFARTITYRQEASFLGPFMLAVIVLFAGYAVGILLARRPPEE